MGRCMKMKGPRYLLMILLGCAVFTQAYGQNSLHFDLSDAQLFFGTILPYSTQGGTVRIQVTNPGNPIINYSQAGNLIWQNSQATAAKIGVRGDSGNTFIFSITIPHKNINLTSGGAFLQLTLDDPVPNQLNVGKKKYTPFYVGGELAINNTKPGGNYTGYYDVVFNYY